MSDELHIENSFATITGCEVVANNLMDSRLRGNDRKVTAIADNIPTELEYA